MFRTRVRSGEYCKAAQFWLFYMNMLRVQQYVHTVIQENDIDLRLYAWQVFLPFCFVLDETNYARYGSYYIQRMINIEEKYPRLTGLLKDSHNVHTSIDQRGEQTINREAKTVGGIKKFAGIKTSVLKWCLNREEEANNSKAINEMCGIARDPGLYKPLRPSQILQSNERVVSALKIFNEDFINPFGLEVNRDELVNIGSGVPLSTNLANVYGYQLKESTIRTI